MVYDTCTHARQKLASTLRRQMSKFQASFDPLKAHEEVRCQFACSASTSG